MGRADRSRLAARLAADVLDTVTIGADRCASGRSAFDYRDHAVRRRGHGAAAELDGGERRICGGRSASASWSRLASPPSGGWLVGRQTLRPLDDMATQAMAITESTAGDRLHTPQCRTTSSDGSRTAFNGLLDRLVHGLQAQRQFMADASHELRTPVSVVRTTAQVTLARDARSSEDYREMMEIVGEQAERLTHLVDTMFLLSRAEANGLPLAARAGLHRRHRRRVRARAAGAGARPRCHGDGGRRDEVRFTGDNRLLRQMVTQPARQRRPSRQRAAAQSRATVASDAVRRSRFGSSDNGPGVPAEARERIFQRFARLNQEYAGAGLGTADRPMDRRGAWRSLVLESSGPGGSTFTVTLTPA